MITSMTGYGRGISGRGQKKIETEIQSVNARFLEIKFKGLFLDQKIEYEIRKLIESTLIRGNIMIRISYSNNQDFQKIIFNKERFELIQDILKNIHVTFGQRLNLSDIISTNDILKIEDDVLTSNSSVLKSVKNALSQLIDMRKNEGKILYEDINNRAGYLKKNLIDIKMISDNYKDDIYKKLHSKVSQLLENEKIDDARLIQEVAHYVERADVTEEIVRCESHLNQLSNFIEIKEPVGKRINFLLQEVGREINTIGSKSPNTEVTIKIVEMKGELEKIREQTSNIL